MAGKRKAPAKGKGGSKGRKKSKSQLDWHYDDPNEIKREMKEHQALGLGKKEIREKKREDARSACLYCKKGKPVRKGMCKECFKNPKNAFEQDKKRRKEMRKSVLRRGDDAVDRKANMAAAVRDSFEALPLKWGRATMKRGVKKADLIPRPPVSELDAQNMYEGDGNDSEGEEGYDSESGGDDEGPSEFDRLMASLPQRGSHKQLLDQRCLEQEGREDDEEEEEEEEDEELEEYDEEEDGELEEGEEEEGEEGEEGEEEEEEEEDEVVEEEEEEEEEGVNDDSTGTGCTPWDGEYFPRFHKHTLSPSEVKRLPSKDTDDGEASLGGGSTPPPPSARLPFSRIPPPTKDGSAAAPAIKSGGGGQEVEFLLSGPALPPFPTDMGVGGRLPRECNVLSRVAHRWAESQVAEVGGGKKSGVEEEEEEEGGDSEEREKEREASKQGWVEAMALLPALRDYRDVLFANRTAQNAHALSRVLALHTLDHCLKARGVQQHNDLRLQGLEQGQPTPSSGFTRAKVLVLTPFRSSALRFVEALLPLLPDSHKVTSLDRFRVEYGEQEDEEEGLGKGGKAARAMPDDWNQVFQGNQDDEFKLGIAFTKKSLRLYSDFYACDLIVASPLGLRLLAGGGSKEEESFGDVDFMSSIEVLIVEQADVLEQQNWDHVRDLISRANLTPRKDHGADFSRVREWALEGQAAGFRQTVLCSAHMSSPLLNVFNRHCHNYKGALKVRGRYTGSIAEVVLQIPQVFQRVPSPSPATAADDRFNFFKQNVYPALRGAQATGTLLFVPDYFDFVRVRNLFLADEIPAAALSEYSRPQDVSRLRSHFYHRRRNVLIYSGRLHFFKRYRIRGARHCIFYGPPHAAVHYPDVINLLTSEPRNGGGAAAALEVAAATGAVSSMLMFSRFDAFALERVVGSVRARRMLAGDKPTYMFR